MKNMKLLVISALIMRLFSVIESLIRLVHVFFHLFDSLNTLPTCCELVLAAHD